MRFRLNSKLILSGLHRETEQQIKNSLTMENPKFKDLEHMGKWTGATPKYLTFYEDLGHALVCPRGFSDRAFGICKAHGEDITIIDDRRILPSVSFDFKGVLRPFQRDSVQAMLSHSHGVLSSGTGSGKTVMALNLITERQQPTIVICHTRELLNQWVDRAVQFLGMERGEIGIIGAGKFTVGDRLTIGMVQTLCKKVGEVKDRFGQIIVDEAHRVPGRLFTDVVTAFDARFLLGFTATAYRNDGLGQAIFLHLGDCRYRVEKKDLLDNGSLCQARVAWHQTEYDTVLNASTEYSKVLSELTQDKQRNCQICRDVAVEDTQGIKLVLSDRKAHCHELQRILKQEHGIEAAVLVGGLSQKARAAVTERISQGKVDVLIATGALIGEGYDLPSLSTLFLGTPIKFSGRLIQFCGRILRPSPGKKRALIHDYDDVHVGVLEHSASVRARTYQNEGIEAA